MAFKAEVVVNIKPITRLQQALISQTGGPLWSKWDRWVWHYVEFLYERFKRHAAGGGTWPALKESTAAAKARQGFSGGILQRTLVLQEELAPSAIATGNVIMRGASKTGVSIVFGRKKVYANGVEVATIMEAHDKGKGNLPRRQIFVQPPTEVLNKISEAAAEDIRKILES